LTHAVRIPRTPTAARPIRIARRRGRRSGLTRRFRGERAQASAVATILGLLLVVLFIANYLTTTLPNQMMVNDESHELQVENQLGRLSALLGAAAGERAIGAQLSAPVTLGSAGQPPFASADGGSIAPMTAGSGMGVSFTLSGPAAYAPPVAGRVGGYSSPGATCPTPSMTGFADVGSCHVIWNFTGNSGTFSFSQTGSGSAVANVTTNGSTISVAGTGSGYTFYEIIGSQNKITMSGVGSGPENVTIFGNGNNLSISTTGSAPIAIDLFGNYNTVTVTSVGSGPVTVVVYGTHDTLSVPSDTGSQKFSVYLDGFNASAPSASLCPYGNLSSTDAVTSFSEVGSGGLTEYVNNNVDYYSNQSVSMGCTGNATCWSLHYRNVVQKTCPFFGPTSIPFSSGVLAAGFIVHLRNTYAPPADVAFDAGAVIYAQQAGKAVLVDPPTLNLTDGTLTVFVPQFVNTVGVEAGIGTAILTTRLLSATSLNLPSGGFSLPSGANVLVTITTPYAMAWMAYFQADEPALYAHASCSGPTAACSGPFYFGGPLGTVKLLIPVTTIDLSVGTFSVKLT
jgi:hypothetical protein